MPHDPLLARLTSVLAEVPGVQAVVLGGSRARGSAHSSSDYDIGLYCSNAGPLDTDRLLTVVKDIADDPGATTVTRYGEWGPWIVGGAWLVVEGQKVDLLYRHADNVERVMMDCRNGTVLMDYQPGHPHGFCSAIWMGEIAYCRQLHDPKGLIAQLKTIALPYPQALRRALIRRFQWEILFSIENAELAAARNERSHIAGMSLQVARLRRAGAVRSERTLPRQREGGIAGSSRLAPGDPTIGGAVRPDLATRR